MDHPLRQTLAGEAHARPTVPVPARALVLHEARLHEGPDGAAQARAYAEALAARAGAPAPRRDVDHAFLTLDGGTLKWERHGEFSTWTYTREGLADAGAAVQPPPCLINAPGQRFVAAAVFVSDTEPDDAALDRALGAESPEADRAGSIISSGLCGVWTGFRIGGDGWTRFLLHDRGLGVFRCGRVVRRLLEIETYRIAALFAFPIAKAARREIDTLEARVGAAIADEALPEGEVLEVLITAARAIERLAQETAFRFGAARAYRTLIAQRLDEFREQRIEGLQRLQAFLDRRFGPAMDTCASTEARLETLAKRVERASGLMRTRIDLAMQEQNAEQLKSMNENARAQLRLQMAVEGFSVAAVSYYAFQLLSKLIHPVTDASHAGVGAWVDAGLVVVVAVTVWWVLRGSRRALDKGK